MIEYHYETDFDLKNEQNYTDWITRIIKGEDASLNKIDFIFCTDIYLLELNKKYLKHDAFTDIITFDYSKQQYLSGDIFISIERVRDNAKGLNIVFNEELLRVMSHGVLHLLGFNDKSEAEVITMRAKEEEKIKLFHVEH